MEMKESTMTEMRLLSKLLIAFSVENTAVNVSAEDMFIRDELRCSFSSHRESDDRRWHEYFETLGRETVSITF